MFSPVAKKSMLWNSVTSWKAPSASAACGSISPADSCCDAWRRGSRWARGQVSMGDEAEPCNPMGRLIVSHAVTHCRGGELGPFWRSGERGG